VTSQASFSIFSYSMMQKFLNGVFAFGDSIPHEREIGIALIIVGVIMIMYFQMEPSIPAREPAAAASSPKKATTPPALAEKEKKSTTPSRARSHSKARASPAPKSSPKATSPKGSVKTPSGERRSARARGKTPVKK